MPTIKKRESYRWTVRHELARRAGRSEALEFDVEFRALPQTRVNELVSKAVAGRLDNESFISETMAGWHDLVRDGDSAPWEFSVSAVRELCELYPGLAVSLSRAWTESVTGGAALKN